MSIVTYENVDTPVFEIDYLRYLFANGEAGLWLPFTPDHLYADVDKTVPAVFGGGIASFDDLSGNGITGPQSVSTARPIMGRVPRTGRRNLVSTSTYTANGAGIVVEGGYPDSAGGMDAYLAECTEDTTNRFARTGEALQLAEGTEYVGTFRIKAGTVSQARVGLLGSGGLSGWGGSSITLEGPGTTSGGAPHLISDLSETEWTQVTIRRTTDAVGNLRVAVYPRTTSGQFAGDSVYVHQGQIEIGSEPTPYQRVGSEYDVTEAGVPSVYYARYDSADDVLPRNATLPAITDGTVVLIGQQGIWIDEGYSFAGGNWSFGPTTYPNGPTGIIGVVGDMLDLVVLDRPLTPQERKKVIQAGIKRGSPGEIE